MTHAFLQALHRSGISSIARLLPHRHLVVLNFHRVRDESSDFHDGMVELGTKEFREHLAWLERHARIVSEAELADLRPGRRPPVLLTFDDGYRDAVEVVAPVLRERKIPAIFFVAPGLIDKRVLGAWDRIAYLVKRFPGDSFRFRGRDFSLAGGTRQVYFDLGKRSQNALPDRGDDFVAELSATLGVKLPGPDVQGAELLTWDQIRELASGGFAIGCHGYSHRVLSSLPLAEQESEILLARARLATERISPRSFAYPYGTPYTYSWETRESVLRAGFRYVFSFAGQAPRLSRFDPARIDRVAFKSSVAKYDFLLTFPGVHNVVHRLRSGREA